MRNGQTSLVDPTSSFPYSLSRTSCGNGDPIGILDLVIPVQTGYPVGVPACHPRANRDPDGVPACHPRVNGDPDGETGWFRQFAFWGLFRV